MSSPSNPRPWFSDHGEGYCRVCRFVEPLDRLGRLEVHPRHRGGPFDVGSSAPCPGAGEKPGAKIPWSSRLAAFRTKVRTEVCKECGRRIAVDPVDGRLNRHRPAFNSPTICMGGDRQAPPAPGRERG